MSKDLANYLLMGLTGGINVLSLAMSGNIEPMLNVINGAAAELEPAMQKNNMTDPIEMFKALAVP